MKLCQISQTIKQGMIFQNVRWDGKIRSLCLKRVKILVTRELDYRFSSVAW